MPVFLCTSSHQHWCEPTVSLALKRIASLVSTTPHQHQQSSSSFPGPTSGETVQPTSIGEPLSAGLKGLGLLSQTKIYPHSEPDMEEMKEEERKSRHLLPLCATVGRTHRFQVRKPGQEPSSLIVIICALPPNLKSQGSNAPVNRTSI